MQDIEGISRHYFDGAGCRLSVLETGPDDGPVMIVVHGMRDHAVSLLPFASFFGDHHMFVPDLRGHGESDNPGVYGLVQYVADLKALFDRFSIDRAVLVGHSLGGHISARFDALYPGLVDKLVLIDGLGPPGITADDEASLEARVTQWHQAVDACLSSERHEKPLASRDEAKDRLIANNPRLSAEHADLIVRFGVDELADGSVEWKFDTRVNMIWTTFSHEENERLHGRIHCPVLIVTGEHSLEYWTRRRGHLKEQDVFYEAELDRKTGFFKDATRVVIPNAGHMLHYDEPVRLAEAVAAFLN